MITDLGSRARMAGGLGAAALVLAATTATAVAAPKPISGKLSKPSYEVLALAASGEANSGEADRKFSVRPPAKEVTLHLQAPDGTYAGPIVVGKERNGRRAIVGVRSGAKLGRIQVKVAKGYAKAAEPPPGASLDPDQQARARKGVPLGAGVFGRVRSGGSSAARPDSDLDGLPNPLDVDDDGDLVLDNLDTSDVGRRALRTPADPCGPGRIYCQDISSGLGLQFEQIVNANLGSTNAQIDAALATFGGLRIRIGAYAALGPGDTAELDCGDPNTGLAYCRQNGSTGTIGVGGGPGSPFPACCDADGDGFGTLAPFSGGGPNDFFLAHGAQARVPGLDPALDDPSIPKIGTGDPIKQWVTSGGGDPSQCPPLSGTCVMIPSLVQYVIATVPTLVSYNDGAGHSPTIAYPAPTTQNPPPGIAPGSGGNGLPVSDSPDDTDTDVEVTLTFWRPQRKPILDPDPTKSEKCPTPADPDRLCTPDDWIDIGGLTYAAGVRGPPGGGGCPQSSFSSADSQLSPPSIPPVINFPGGFTDGAPERPADPGSTFTYELNLTQCIAALGSSFEIGEERTLEFSGQHGGDSASQIISFKRE